MNGLELEALRIRLGVSTQEQMAQLLCCDFVGYRRYASGSRQVPRYIERSARLLEFVYERGMFDDLCNWLRALHASGSVTG